MSIALFTIVIAITLGITYWASRRSRTTSDLYIAGGTITAWQNGLALTGDILSAATFLGLVGMFFVGGHDAILFVFPTMIGLAFMVGFIVVPLRRLGKYTFADVVAVRLSPIPIRIFASLSTLAITMMYMIVQIVGAGTLIQLLFHVPYQLSVVLVGTLMTIYVVFGGMLATTWVQIVKATLLLGCLALLAVLSLAQTNFSLSRLYLQAAAAHQLGANLFQPGGLKLSSLQYISLALGISFGVSGMPHILMRLFTVPSPRVASESVVICMALMASAVACIFVVIAPAGVAFVGGNAAFIGMNGLPQGGANMVTLHLASFLGGPILFGIVAAITFATILAVVSGLTVAAASALSHDLFANVFWIKRQPQEYEATVFRASCLLIGLVSIGLGVAFEGQNILYLVAVAYVIAASACFPVLIMVIYWDKLTTRGALAGGYAGLIAAVGLIVLGPSVWVGVLKHAKAIIPLDYPAIFSVPLAFAIMIAVSLWPNARAVRADFPIASKR